MAPLLKKIKAFICCQNVENDDVDQLLDNEQIPQNSLLSPPNSIAERGANGSLSIGGPSGIAGRSSDFLSIQDQQHPRTKSEQEEDMINDILDRTQRSMIDINNLGESDIDVERRSRIYNEALKQYDAQAGTSAEAFGGSVLPPDVVTHFLEPSTSNEIIRSLNGEEAAKLDSDVLLLDDMAGKINDVLVNEMSAEPDEDLVAYIRD